MKRLMVRLAVVIAAIQVTYGSNAGYVSTIGNLGKELRARELNVTMFCGFFSGFLKNQVGLNTVGGAPGPASYLSIIPV